MTATNETKKSRVEAYIRWVMRWRWAVVAAMLLLALGVGTGARHLGLATSYRVFFGKDNPDLILFEDIEDIYSQSDSVLFVIKPAEGDVFNPRTIAMVEELTERAWQTPYSTRVDSITNFQHTWAEGDDLIVEDLLPQGRTDAEAIARVREVSMNEPLLAGRLIARDGRTTGINVRIQLPDPGHAEQEMPEIVSYVRALGDEFRERYPGHRIALTGIVMMNAAFTEAPFLDAVFVMPIMFGALLLVMTFFLRSALATGATMTLVMLATVTALGIAGYAGLMFDPASASAPVIILTLGIADSVHILVSFFNALRRKKSKDESIIEAFRINAQPVFLTSVTSAIGFLSLNFSDSPPFHVLGNIAAVGVMLAWFFSMTFLPAAMAILPLRAPKGANRMARLSSALAEFVVVRPKPLLAVLGVLALLIISAVPTLVINDDYVRYFGKSLPIRQDSEFALNNLTGFFIQSYSVESAGPQGINDPEFLRSADAFAEWARTSPSVVHVSSFTDTMKRLNMNMHGDDPAYYRLPDERALAGQYLLLYEMSLPYGLDVNDQINVDKSALRIDVTFGDVPSFETIVHSELTAGWLRENGGAITDIKSTGNSMLFGRITARNLEGMVYGTGLGFIVISFIMILALRSVRVGLLSLIPNILPTALAFGIWAMVFREVGFAISIIAGLAIGIIVDDTVHFLAKYEHARRELGKNAPDAVRYAFEVAGPAIISTSFIVAGGFAMLGLSTFVVTTYMGLLTSLVVICALFADLFLLPPMLLLLDRREDRAPAASLARLEPLAATDEL